MSSWKTAVIILLIVTFIGVVNCDKYGIKKKPHHHDMMCGAGLLYYLTFLALKVKIALIIGGVIVTVLFFGKIWALIAYGKYMLGDKPKEPEKIYIQPPPHHDIHHGPPDFHHDFHGPPDFHAGGFDEHAFLDHPPPSYHKRSPNEQAFLDQPPNSYMEYAPPGGGAYMDHPPKGGDPGMMMGNAEMMTKMYPTIAPQSYQSQRGFRDSFLNDLNRVAKFMEKLDLTEMAFNSMKLKGETCRRRYVCEVDVRSKQNALLALSYSIFSNKALERYRSDVAPTTMDDCETWYPDCEITEPTK